MAAPMAGGFNCRHATAHVPSALGLTGLYLPDDHSIARVCCRRAQQQKEASLHHVACMQRTVLCVSGGL